MVAGIFCISFVAVLTFMEEALFKGAWYPILILVILLILLAVSLVVVYCQPASLREPSFSVPFVPWLPGISILFNIYLMFQLDIMTWVRFSVWIAAGIFVYFAYGVWHSKERPSVKRKLIAHTSSVDKVIPELSTSTHILTEEKNN